MRTPLRFVLAGLIAFGWTTASVNGAADGVTTVFVGPAAATQQTPKLTAELEASVADLRKALKKKSSVRLVDTPETADVSCESRIGSGRPIWLVPCPGATTLGRGRATARGRDSQSR